jgi:signal transduction histidine kinase
VSGPLALVGGSVATGALTATLLARCWLASQGEAMARACHELRGPITAARLGLELGLRAGKLPGDRLRALELELERATLALDDLSELWQRPARISVRRARHRVRGEAVDIAQLLADSVEAWRPTAMVRGVELRLVRSDTTLVFGERLRLAQATGNLIANAIEHGGGTVEVSLRSDLTSVRVEVVDGGPGLPAPVTELARHRARATGRRRSISPRGHGLAIASAIARAHGGRLAGAPSERGAKLVLELPAGRRAALTEPVSG